MVPRQALALARPCGRPPRTRSSQRAAPPSTACHPRPRPLPVLLPVDPLTSIPRSPCSMLRLTTRLHPVLPVLMACPLLQRTRFLRSTWPTTRTRSTTSLCPQRTPPLALQQDHLHPHPHPRRPSSSGPWTRARQQPALSRGAAFCTRNPRYRPVSPPVQRLGVALSSSLPRQRASSWSSPPHGPAASLGRLVRVPVPVAWAPRLHPSGLRATPTTHPSTLLSPSPSRPSLVVLAACTTRTAAAAA